jgi:hypothetical protein
MRLDDALDMATDALANLFEDASPEESEKISDALEVIDRLFNLLADLGLLLIRIDSDTDS